MCWGRISGWKVSINSIERSAISEYQHIIKTFSLILIAKTTTSFCSASFSSSSNGKKDESIHSWSGLRWYLLEKRTMFYASLPTSLLCTINLKMHYERYAINERFLCWKISLFLKQNKQKNGFDRRLISRTTMYVNKTSYSFPKTHTRNHEVTNFTSETNKIWHQRDCVSTAFRGILVQHRYHRAFIWKRPCQINRESAWCKCNHHLSCSEVDWEETSLSRICIDSQEGSKLA